MLFQAKMSSYTASYDEFYNTGSLFIVSNVLNWHQFFTLKIKATFSCYTFFLAKAIPFLLRHQKMVSLNEMDHNKRCF